jgi:hypothetical protein
MKAIKELRRSADALAKVKAQQPSGGSQVTQDNALSQRAAQQLRMQAMRTKTAVAAPESLAATLRKLRNKQ